MPLPLSQAPTMVSTSTERYSTRYDFDQPLIIITSLSICAAIAILPLSALHIQESYLTVGATSLTIIFHVAYFAMRYRDILRRRHHPRGPKSLPLTYSWGTIVGASLLAILYINAIWLQIALQHRDAPIALASSADKMEFNAQTVLSVVEVLLIVLMAVMLGFARRHYFLHKDDITLNIPAPSLSRETTSVSSVRQEKFVDISLKA
jgi:amino acid transporter